MAKIIDYDAHEQMSTQGTGVPVDPKMASTGGRIMSDWGSTIKGESDKLMEARVVSEEAKARNETEVKLAQIKQEATMDPNLTPEKTAEYQTKMQTALSDGANKISLPFYRDRFKEKYSTKAQIEGIKLDNIYYRKFRDEARANFKQSKQIQEQNFINASSVGEKQTVVGEFLADMAEQTRAGWYTKEQAETETEKTLKKWNESHLQYDLNTRPSWAKAEIEKGDKGFYQGFPKEMLAKAMVMAKKNENFLVMKQRNDTENQFVSMDTAGVLTPEHLEEAHLAGNISRTFYEKMKGKIDGNYGPTANTDKQTYYDLTEKLVDPNIKTEDKRTALIQASGEGKLSVEDYKKLYNFHVVPSDQGPQSMSDAMGGAKAEADLAAVKAVEDEKSKELEDRNAWYKAAFGTLTGALGRDAHAVADAKMKLYDRIQKGNVKPQDIPHEAEAVVRENRVKKNPWIKNLPKEGAVVGDGWRYFPDGSAVKESKKNG